MPSGAWEKKPVRVKRKESSTWTVAGPRRTRFEKSRRHGRCHLFAKVRENPTTRCGMTAPACPSVLEAIISLGGGSSMDTAKGCNFLLTNGGRVEILGRGQSHQAHAAAHSHHWHRQCQSAALIADEITHQKMACLIPAPPPAYSLDPALTLRSRRGVTTAPASTQSPTPWRPP
jgi:alcohol dehydrogenase class IV